MVTVMKFRSEAGKTQFLHLHMSIVKAFFIILLEPLDWGPQGFQKIHLFSLKFHPKSIKSQNIFNFPTPSFCAAPSVLEKL